MVLPLLIVGGVLIVGSLAAWKSSDSVKKIVYDLTASDDTKSLDLEKSKQDFTVSKRGFLNNGFAYIFGESFYAEVFNDKAAAAPVLTGEKKQTMQEKKNDRLNNKKRSVFTDG